MEAMNLTAPSRRRDGLLAGAVALSVASAALLAAHVSFDKDAFRHCRHLGPSARMYVTAWVGPLCSVAALVTCAGGFRRRGRAWPVMVCAVLGLLLCVQVVALCWVYAPDPSGGYDCSGLAGLKQ
ncbi:hypothetical protein ACFCWG_31890 [Streptomyces sp. NPDC056390]|uniref:hypothetical protein n=1 Tax=Streptomyces sp. NPDC056390 TaxID=3345806 RepID=UPI0035E2F90C